MTIPDFQSTMRPLLSLIVDGQDHRIADVVEQLAETFRLTEEERREMLPSGRSRLFYNRVAWAKSHLAHAGLIEAPTRGVFRITPTGIQALEDCPTRIDLRYLNRFEDYRAFRSSRAPSVTHGTGNGETPAEIDTPEEAMDRAWAQIRQQTAKELLERIASSPPSFFEQLVVDLLVAMGYGGSRVDAGKSVGGSGDGGVDGVIKEDKLGLDAVYVQAKRWGNTVGRPVVQAFAGSLEGYRARKGVLITTSTFSTEAREYVDRIEKRIVLVDGDMLAELMLDHSVGVTPHRVYTVPRIDLDYFEQA